MPTTTYLHRPPPRPLRPRVPGCPGHGPRPLHRLRAQSGLDDEPEVLGDHGVSGTRARDRRFGGRRCRLRRRRLPRLRRVPLGSLRGPG